MCCFIVPTTYLTRASFFFLCCLLPVVYKVVGCELLPILYGVSLTAKVP